MTEELVRLRQRGEHAAPGEDVPGRRQGHLGFFAAGQGEQAAALAEKCKPLLRDDAEVLPTRNRVRVGRQSLIDLTLCLGEHSLAGGQRVLGALVTGRTSLREDMAEVSVADRNGSPHQRCQICGELGGIFQSRHFCQFAHEFASGGYLAERHREDSGTCETARREVRPARTTRHRGEPVRQV